MMFTDDIFKGEFEGDNWGTPEKLYRELAYRFNFTLDPCCTLENRKCDNFYTKESNGLIQHWGTERVFVNPPYSKGNIDLWAKKCYLQKSLGTPVIVGLLPVSTSSGWFHSWVWHKAELEFLKGRLKFVGAKHTAPFSSVIVIWK